MINAGIEVGDTWWVLLVDIDKSGKTQDLEQTDREVEIEVSCTDAAGHERTVSDVRITWKLTVVGQGDHLVQIGERIVVTGPKNICYAEDPPPPTKIQITNSEFPLGAFPGARYNQFGRTPAGVSTENSSVRCGRALNQSGGASKPTASSASCA